MSICAVIPAYNEARRIGELLSVLQQAEFLSMIIVVDDGSSDGTDKIVQAVADQGHRVRLVIHTRNFGKGAALFTGTDLYRRHMMPC